MLEERAIRVLHVEDDPDNAELIRRILARRPGHELRHAATGRAGIEAVADFDPDLVLLDLNLPDLSGEEVLAQLRGAGSRVPVLIVTADATAATSARLAASGAAGVLTKPFEIESVYQWVTLLAGAVRAQQD